MRKLVLFIGALLCVWAVQAERVVELVYSAAEPVLDGKLDEACYRQGVWQQNFVNAESRAGADETTAFKVLNSPRGLWIAVKVQDKKLVSQVRKTDDPVWHDDSIEITIAPTAKFASDKNVREYAHLIINAHGSRYDAYNVGGIDSADWNPSWYTAAQRTDDGFTLEIFLPFTMFSDRNITGGDWRFNLFRTHKGGRITRYSAWNPAKRIADSDNYGIIRNVECNKERFTVNVENLSFRKIVKDNSTLTVFDSKFKVRKNTAYTVAAAMYYPDGTFANLADTVAVSDAQGILKAELLSAINVSGDCRVRLTVADEQGKVFDAVKRVHANLAPMSVKVLHPVYRNTLFSSDQDRQIRTVLNIDLPEDIRKKSSLVIEVNDASGKVFSRQIVANPPERYEYKLDAKNAPVGTLTVKFCLDWKEGWVVRHEFYIASASRTGSEVYINRRGNLTVDGKEFFVHGFMGAYKDFDDMQKATCNTVHFYTLNRRDIAEIIARLDECHKRGLRVLLSPFHKMSIGFYGVNRGGKVHTKLTAQEWVQIEKLVLAIKDHPALLGWAIFDEPRGSEWHAELQKVYKLLCRIDLLHPVFGVDNGADSCINLQNACDVIALDMYMNHNEKGEPLRPVSMILNSVERISRNLQPGKMLIYTPQAFDVDSFMPPGSPRKHLPPTVEESSAAVFGALAAGARGIMAYKIGNKALAKPGERHSNSGIYADESLRKAYLDIIMPTLTAEAGFFLQPGAIAPAVDGKRVLVKTMPDGSKRMMSVSEKRQHTIEFKNIK